MNGSESGLAEVLRRDKAIEENFGEPGERFDEREGGEVQSRHRCGRGAGQVVVMLSIATVAVASAAVVAFVIGGARVVMMGEADGSRFFERGVCNLVRSLKHLFHRMAAETEGVSGKEEYQQGEGSQQSFMIG